MQIQFVARRQKPLRVQFKDLKVGDWYTLQANNGCPVFQVVTPTASFEQDSFFQDLLKPKPDTLVYPRDVKLLVEKI